MVVLLNRSHSNETVGLSGAVAATEYASARLGLRTAQYGSRNALHSPDGSPICELFVIFISFKHYLQIV